MTMDGPPSEYYSLISIVVTTQRCINSQPHTYSLQESFVVVAAVILICLEMRLTVEPKFEL